MKGFKNAEEFILSNPQWQEALILLREIFLSGGMEETIKWGVPVYMAEGKNITGMACFKSYVGIWFYQGALLNDKANKLVSAQEGKTKALRQWRFTSVDEINRDYEIICQYVNESIENTKKGLGIKPERNIPLQLPDELAEVLENDLSLKQVFDSMSISKKRDYAEFIASAKKTETKMARMEKIIPLIRQAKGLYDKYNK